MNCSGFILQCSLYFEMQPRAFPTERSKIAFMITLLTGRALQWAESLWNSDSPMTQTFDDFTTHFKEVFGQAGSELSVQDRLFRLSQGRSSVWDYSVQFRTLTASSGWNETALITFFRRGLNPRIRQQMAIYDDTVGLETFISKAIRISQHLTACEEDMPLAPPLSVTSPAPAPEPMQISFNPLTLVERERRINSGLCLYCRTSGHLLQTCPVRPPRPAVSTIQLNPQISTLTRMTIQLISPHTSIPAQALVDSGSSGNFISIETLNRLHLKQKLHSQTLNVQTIQGKPLGRGKVRHRSPTITLRVGCLHEEVLSFLVLEHSTVDVVLGRPWLTQHSPNMDWKNNEVLQWSEYCQQHCLLRITPPTSSLLQNCSTSVESPEPEKKFTYPMNTVRSRTSSVSRPPLNYHHIGHGTAQSTCCLERNSRKVECILCPSRSRLPWRNTFRRLSDKASSVHLHLQLRQASSLSARRMEG